MGIRTKTTFRLLSCQTRQSDGGTTWYTGQRVRITRSVLADTEGQVIRWKADGRCVVTIELLDRAVSLELDPDWFEAY